MLRTCLLSLLLFACAAVARPAVAQDRFAEVSAAMEAFVQDHELAGASLRVNRSGAVVYDQSFGGYDQTTRIPIGSGTKWLSAIVIARLVDRGVIGWDSTVGEYFPDAPADTVGITLAQLFSHTSGLPYEDDDCLSTRSTTLDACARRILARPLIAAPGTAFAYSGNSMQVAGRMAEIASGQRWDDLFVDQVALPLGLVATDWSMISTAPGYVRNPNPRIAGGARTTLDDFGRVMDMVLAGGRAGGRQFLSIKTLETMARDRTVGTVDVYRPAALSAGYGYGIGQWIERSGGARYMAGQPLLSSIGAFGFTAWVDHRRHTSGVLMVRDLLPRVSADIASIRTLVEQATRSPSPVVGCGVLRRPACLHRRAEDTTLRRSPRAASRPVAFRGFLGTIRGQLFGHVFA